ncbi:LOB domain-containing protein 36 [Ziziphus jujuba]|uniref:LOB domain-containing protein 36 n=2 Tax=Ziziphus jujuba TaxID=326968 RepID=A0A6P3YWI7_ZIZJJ|nr:LOB domain-containing protein 36 [Ziziphus jujuba]KAH7520136.1 hypothetical protein FEM48_Zijuj08G0112300 [Ziziphus jujuba var. spinosa]
MSPSNSPCAACKLQRRKCTQECVFAPYFPPDQPQKFENVHKVFGASNVAKLLNELNANQREDAVNSLAYEADARLRDPVYGCVGLISILQHKLKEVQSDLYNAKKELATYLGPQALHQILQPPTYLPQTHPGPSSSSVLPYNMSPMMGIPTGPSPSGQLVICDPLQQQHQTQQIFEAQQLAAAVAAREQQEMFRTSFEQKQALHQQQQQTQQPQDLLRFNSGGFDSASGSVTATGFNQMTAAAMSPSLALGNFDLSYHIQPQQPEHHNPHHTQLQAQILLPPQEPQVQQQQSQQTQQSQQQQTDQGEEGRGVGQTC